MKDEEVRKAVRENYGKIALQKTSCCGTSSGCSCNSGCAQDTVGKAIGYSDEEISAVPEGANLGLGCGNPTALASLKMGEAVLDLGSGAGFDCFLASDKVGESGRVIGVDMTAEMLEKARENAIKGTYNNVEFRLGEIENLPVANDSVDVVISNCVINLSPKKERVFQEAFRVLKPGGRVMVSDIILLKELPLIVKNSIKAYVGCVAGAITREDYIAAVTDAGFCEVEVIKEMSVKGLYNIDSVQELISDLEILPEVVKEAEDSIVSIQIKAFKPL
ncbi:arsenite methyltransferase [Chloroflexota bacterium]